LSLILDALNRSREDSDPVPGLATRHDTKVAQPAAWRRYLPWTALLVAVLIIGVLLFEREETVTEQPTALAPAPSRGESSRLEAPAVVPPAPQAVEKSPEISRAAAPAINPRVAPGSPPAASRREPEPAAAPPKPMDPEIAQLYQRSDDVSSVQGEPAPGQAEPAITDSGSDVAAAPLPPAREEQPVDIEQLVLQAEEEMENARLAEHVAPFIADLSQQTKNDIPTVYYQRHDYAGEGSRSKVVLNGKPLGEGGSPVPGMKVVEILPDSVVLDYRGTQFRLRALNSWVNL
jgi:hypothetical protein